MILKEILTISIKEFQNINNIEKHVGKRFNKSL